MTLRPRTLLSNSLIIAVLFAPTISLAQLPISPSKLQVYSVQHTTAADVAKKLQATLATIEPTAEVIVDAPRNRIIVNGGPRVQGLALQMLQTVDRPAQTIRQVTAQEQQVVKDYIVPAAELDRITATLEKNFPAANVVKNPRLSQVIVIGSQTDQNKIAAWLANQNAARAPRPIPATLGASTTQTFPLRALTPDQMVQQLSHLLADRVVQTRTQNGALTTFVLRSVDAQVRLQVDQVNRRVLLTGPQNLLPRWARLVSALDKPLQSSTRAMSLDHAAPADVRRTIGLLRQASHVERGLATAAIPLGNGGESVFQVAAQPGQDEGGPPMPPDPATGDLGNDVEDPDSGLIGDVQIVFIPELGIIVLRGRDRDVERVRRIIAQIEDTSKTVQPEIEIVYLQHLNGQTASELVIELYDQVFAPRQGPLSITSLDKPNAILLIGRKEAMVVVKDLIAKLDEPVPASTQLKVFRLEHISATDAEAAIGRFFVDQPATGAVGQPGGGTTGDRRPGLGTRARVVADIRTNALIVQAGPRDMLEITRFISEIDQDGPLPKLQLVVFRLQNTLAIDLAPVLQSALTGQAQQGLIAPGVGGQTTTTPPASRLEILGLDAEGQRLITSGGLADVTVTADPNVNALIVRAPLSSIDLIAELIRQLDQGPNAESMVKVFRVTNGDATTLAGILQLLFGQQVTAGQGALGGVLGQAFGGPQAAVGESSLIPLRIVAETRTNSIIVSGTSGDLNVVEILLLRLDQENIETRKMVVYKLMNAPALDVANTITTMLSSQRQLIQQQFNQNQFVSPYQQFESEIIVVPELVTNSLIVSATPQYFDQMITIIKELDYRPPMVMIQCLVCEVELTDGFEFGVELGLQDSLLFDRGVLLGDTTTLPNATTGELLAGQALSTFNLGLSSASTGYGGMVLSAGNESVNILVRAMQDAGRLQVLSKPQIMALNNQLAFIQVGAQVPRITGVSVSPQGGSQNLTEDVPVGMLLRIQPRINDDGLVVMIIDVERSEVGPAGSGIPIAIGENGQVINSPQIFTTTAQTTVSAQDGQTVVFAGLIQKSRAVNTRRIPILSDIPVVGRLFRFDAESESRKELLIFMTPHIMKDKGDTDWLNYVESQRLSWCLSDIVEMYGDVGMSGGYGLWGPATLPMIYPDDNPALDHGHDLEGMEEAPVEGSRRLELQPATPMPIPRESRRNAVPSNRGARYSPYDARDIARVTYEPVGSTSQVVRRTNEPTSRSASNVESGTMFPTSVR
ncbi:MAG TPA: general secretion pathway protein GspD [Planctomycetes bacterium]|nr:general secretion pathway protein GspD [Planctomycetota bacterium]